MKPHIKPPRLCHAAALLLATSILSGCHSLSAPQHDDGTPPTAAKGEWSLATLAAAPDWDTSQLRYRISLRQAEQTFSLAAPCSRFTGRYRADNEQMRFYRIQNHDITCLHRNEAAQLQNLLEQTRRYRPDDDRLIWQDENGNTLAVWQRIYL